MLKSEETRSWHITFSKMHFYKKHRYLQNFPPSKHVKLHSARSYADSHIISLLSDMSHKYPGG
jgi:hypothetical protein